MINPGSCSGEVVSDTDSNGSRFDYGEDRGEDLCDSGGESDDGTDGGGGGGGGDDGGCSVNNDDKDRNLKKEIVSCIIRGLILAEEMKTSIKNMESLLEYAKGLYCKGDSTLEKYWPSNWRETERLLKEEGYEDPKQYFICLDESHHANYDIMEDKNSRCRFCGKPGAIEYYYLGLPQKVKLWCSDESMCQKMAKLWEEKDHWLHHEGPWFPLKEVWDGSRFSEVSWFWDPDCEWLLPTRCDFCSSVLSAEEIEGSLFDGQSYMVICPECGSKNTCKGEKAKGNPRNIALIGHWDGWYPFRSKANHSCGAIEVSVLNLSRKDRCCTDEVYVVGFVPCYKVPNKRACALDPFLEPLVRDLEDSFMRGTKVKYATDVIGGCSTVVETVVRCLLLLWTGDYPAQCEVGKFINCGIFPCRRHYLRGTNIANRSTYYIANNRHRIRFPVQPRVLVDEVPRMSQIEEEDRPTVRSSLARQSGYTGLSILHRLHKLYGFNIILDTVFDMMHNIPLNVVSKHLNCYLNEETFDKSAFDERLKRMPWTSELKDGRIPKSCSKTGHWRAEEYRKFAFPASECILGGLIDDEQFKIWVLAARMAEMVYYYGRNGWQEHDLYLFENLAKRHMILVEEQLGLDQCVVTAHNLEHAAEDILRFSSPDNYWCEVYERAVSNYIATSSNKKNIELTFAKAEARRELLKSLKCKISLQGERRSGNSNQAKLCASSACEAEKLYSESHEVSVSGIESGGILVGKQQNNHYRLSSQEVQIFHEQNPTVTRIESECFSFPRLWKPSSSSNGILYRTGETVIIADNDEEEIVARVEGFICAVVDEQFHSFVRGNLYPTVKDDDGLPEQYCYNFGKIVVPSLQQLITPTEKILRKVILYPDPENLASPSHFIVIDFMRQTLPVSWETVTVPFYPEPDDVVIVACADGENYISLIKSVQERDKTVKLFYYIEDPANPGAGLYVRESYGHGSLQLVGWDCILGLAEGHWDGNAWKQEIVRPT